MAIIMMTYLKLETLLSKLQKLPDKYENIKSIYCISRRKQIQRQKERAATLHNLILLKRYMYV